jgi:hypothetical protein
LGVAAQGHDGRQVSQDDRQVGREKQGGTQGTPSAFNGFQPLPYTPHSATVSNIARTFSTGVSPRI